ncbi:MAG: hypothetical protein ACTSVW_01385 [Candidatus Njordarchaeales archaeon]
MKNIVQDQEKRHIGVLPLFDPQKGTTVLESPGKGSGYWVGAPSIIYDKELSRFYLYYRARKPRPVRGGECYIAESNDGVKFTPIWKAKKEDFNSSSIEKAALTKTPEGRYRLYISFVDPADNRWRIDMMETSHPAKFKVAKRTKILTASSIKCEGVKDPYVMIIGRKYYLMVSYAFSTEKIDEDLKKRMHATADVYNTGMIKSYTGLALSNDGVNFNWWGNILSPGKNWDAYTSRISCILYLPPVFTAFYDGASTVKENYEEKTGLAISFDLMHYDKLTKEEPRLVSPHASRSLRYMDGIIIGDEIYYYYEYAVMDGSHELRMNKVKLR